MMGLFKPYAMIYEYICHICQNSVHELVIAKISSLFVNFLEQKESELIEMSERFDV